MTKLTRLERAHNKGQEDYAAGKSSELPNNNMGGVLNSSQDFAEDEHYIEGRKNAEKQDK